MYKEDFTKMFAVPKAGVCVKCMSKLVKVCSSGCACYSWACPSCRGKTTGLIASVNNTVMLRGLLNASQAKLKGLRGIHDLDRVNNLYRLLTHTTQALAFRRTGAALLLPCEVCSILSTGPGVESRPSDWNPFDPEDPGLTPRDPRATCASCRTFERS